MTWFLHRTAVHAFFSEHNAISVSLAQELHVAFNGVLAKRVGPSLDT